MFVLQNAPDAAPALQGVQASRLPLAGHSAKFDLTLMLRETAGSLHARWEYSSDLFDAASVERMTQHFRTLLEGVVADADQRIGELPLLTASERHRLLVEWNDTATDYPQDRCIHQLFEEQAARTPDAVAVVFEDEWLSYGELEARANRLAHHLRGCGVGPEVVVVGLCLERSPAMVIGLLAILKAGGAYLPLDPAYPRERLSFMLKDAGAPVLLTHSALAARLPAAHAHTVRIDADAAVIAAQPTSAPALALDPRHPAYVIYTSGSTGTPKGVTLCHYSAVAILRLGPRRIRHRGCDKYHRVDVCLFRPVDI
jgi:non-ribosomal peptide synthetase component F